jgi:uncharacterized protein YceK
MRWLLVALTVLLLSGCSTMESGSSSASGEPIPRRDANDLATVRAMAGLDKATPTARGAQSTATATVATAVDTPTPEPPSKSLGEVSDEMYYDTLLAPADIASDWTYGNSERMTVASFCDAAPIEETFSPVGWAHGLYSTVRGQWAEQWVVRLTETDAQAAMEYARASLACKEFTRVVDGTGATYWEFNPLQVPAIGDDVHAVQVNITYENPIYTPYVGHIVFVRKADYVVAMMYYGFTIDPELTAYMAEIAVARLDLVTDSSV